MVNENVRKFLGLVTLVGAGLVLISSVYGRSSTKGIRKVLKPITDPVTKPLEKIADKIEKDTEKIKKKIDKKILKKDKKLSKDEISMKAFGKKFDDLNLNDASLVNSASDIGFDKVFDKDLSKTKKRGSGIVKGSPEAKAFAERMKAAKAAKRAAGSKDTKKDAGKKGGDATAKLGKHKGHKTKRGLSQDQKKISKEKHEKSFQKSKVKKDKQKVIIFEQSKGKWEVRIITGNRTRTIFGIEGVSKSKAEKFAKKIRAGKTTLLDEEK